MDNLSLRVIISFSIHVHNQSQAIRAVLRIMHLIMHDNFCILTGAVKLKSDDNTIVITKGMLVGQ